MWDALLVGRTFASLICSTRGGPTSPDPSMELPENALRILGAWERPRARSLTWLFNVLAIAAISVYQMAASKGLVRRACCLHYPSCSRYAILAFRRYRFLEAVRRARVRVAECGVNSGRPFVDFP
jgi:putative component of membrane protein insertase Oxa1/YidC/SpoIIIJ protein YidD